MLLLGALGADPQAVACSRSIAAVALVAVLGAFIVCKGAARLAVGCNAYNCNADARQAQRCNDDCTEKWKRRWIWGRETGFVG
jgi:hypothetical protein